MKVQIERSFPLPAGAPVAWGVLQDIEAVASCMPGAKITEHLDERHFKGTVGVRFGPAAMSFRGELEIQELDPAARKIRMVGKGTDSTGSSGASLDLTARVDAIDAGHCTLVGTSEVSVSGKAATFGGRMMNAVADQVLQKFADNFAARLAAAGPGGPPSPPTGATAGGASESSTTPAKELNALSLIWAAFKGWVCSLFGKSPA